jgi:hypothetical protein
VTLDKTFYNLFKQEVVAASATSRIAISGNYMLRRPKRSKIEDVASEEKEEEEILLG